MEYYTCGLIALFNFSKTNSFRCLAAIPIQFAEERQWGPVTSELPFLALLLGSFTGGGANILYVTFRASASQLTESETTNSTLRSFGKMVTRQFLKPAFLQ